MLTVFICLVNLSHSTIVPLISFYPLLWSCLNICTVSPLSLHGRHRAEKRSNAQVLLIHLQFNYFSTIVGRLSGRVETWKLICSFLDVSLGHPPCQTPPRLLSGTSSILLDSMMTLWRHIGDGALPRKVETWKLICSFLDVSLRHPPSQNHQDSFQEPPMSS